MQEPIWITQNIALAIHNRQISEHGGDGGIRDAGLLASALARPKNIFAYEPETVGWARLAAAYLVGIAKNHPFVDGNKRVAAVVCESFLNMNDIQLNAPDDEFYAVVLAVATSETIEAEVASWIKTRLSDNDQARA